jgi:hypothetical protein
MSVPVFSEKEYLEMDHLMEHDGDNDEDMESVVANDQLDSGGRLHGQSHGTKLHWHFTKFNKGTA